MISMESARSYRSKLLLGCLALVTVIVPILYSFNSHSKKTIVVRSRLQDGPSGTSRPLFSVRIGGKEGFINSDGDLVIVARFEDVGLFSEGLAAAMIDGKWGYISENGKWVIQPRFAMAGQFHSGRASARINFSDPYGYINTNGKFVIEQQFDCADNFVDGIAKVGTETLTRTLFGSMADVGIECDNFYVDIDGKRLNARIEFHAPNRLPADDELRPVKIDGKMRFADPKGKIVVEPQFDYLAPFKNGLALFTVDGGERFGYINTSGVIVWPASK